MAQRMVKRSTLFVWYDDNEPDTSGYPQCIPCYTVQVACIPYPGPTLTAPPGMGEYEADRWVKRSRSAWIKRHKRTKVVEWEQLEWVKE